MKYDDYMVLAKSCATREEMETVINLAADDYTLSARQYQYIRHIAIDNYYNNTEV